MNKESSKKENRVICLPFAQDSYSEIVNDANKFRIQLDEFIGTHFELFPRKILNGYQLKETRPSKKLSISIRRIKIGRVSYTVRPSFVMPHMCGMVENVSKALLMRKYSVPFHALSYSFGGSSQKWFRMEQALGRNSIVGTTVRSASELPEYVEGDEKHTKRKGSKTYLATTVANNCFFGASLTESATENDLVQGYRVFKNEAQKINSEYSPITVTTDGWDATQKAWQTLFPSIVLILCFLHVFINLRKLKNKFKSFFFELAEKLWHCYQASDKKTFSQRIRRLNEWAYSNELPSCVCEKLEKLRQNSAKFQVAYDHPNASRTSNMTDRIMRRMDRHLFNTQYFHGSQETAESTIRGYALVENFAPSNPYTIRKHNGWQSPAERLNQFRYHDNWLQNLLISASQRQYFDSPPNPL